MAPHLVRLQNETLGLVKRARFYMGVRDLGKEGFA